MALQVHKSKNTLKCEYLIKMLNRLMLVLVVHLPQAWRNVHDFMFPIASRKSCGGRNQGMPIAHVNNSRVETICTQPKMCVANSKTASLQKVQETARAVTTAFYGSFIPLGKDRISIIELIRYSLHTPNYVANRLTHSFEAHRSLCQRRRPLQRPWARHILTRFWVGKFRVGPPSFL